MTTNYDVLILGAGFTGVHAMAKFRDDMGLNVLGLEPAPEPGGVWYWNRYPGARCDFPSLDYSFSFSDEIASEWEWSEKYAAQPEILAYFNFVVDRLDLRRSFDWGVEAKSLNWDDTEKHWVVPTTDGRTLTAKFIIAGTGGLSVPVQPDFPGAERFQGEYYTTRDWPKHPVTFEGKRVGVIGTGSSGIQVIQEIAKTVGELTVFQRTPNYATPMHNRTYTDKEKIWNTEHHAEIRAKASPVSGAGLGDIRPSIWQDSSEEVQKRFDRLYHEEGGLGFAFANYADLLYDFKANEVASEYLRGQIRKRVSDPIKAQLLTPTDHPYTAKRPPLETNYYEVYNQDNVDLVDVLSDPIVEVTEHGLRLESGAIYELDMIVTALGFDAFTGAQLALPMTGRNGVTLSDYWQDGPLAYLGLAVHGFPNYFQFGVGPSVASQFNAPRQTEQQIDFAADLIAETFRRDADTIEATVHADQTWKSLCDGLQEFTLYPLARSTWFLGHNIEGKKPAAYAFYAGAPMYHAIFDSIREEGWGGFAFDDISHTNLPPLVRLDPGAANFVGGMMMAGAPGLDAIPLESLRAQVAAQGGMQLLGRELATIDVPEAGLRLYLPDTARNTNSTYPIVIAYHGGGFVAGNLDTWDPTCHRLAEDLQAIVVNVDYRLAPENPFPAGLTDATNALIWVRENITNYGGDPTRIALLGESAGANLATVVARKAAELSIPLAGQVLLYPVTDGEAQTESKQKFFHGPFLSTPAGDKFWNLYLDSAEVTPDAAPLRASTDQLQGVAAALVLTMEVDPLRDEGEHYAQLLSDAGIEVQSQRFPGLIHSSYSFNKMIPAAQGIHDAIIAFLTEKLAIDAQESLTTAANASNIKYSLNI